MNVLKKLTKLKVIVTAGHSKSIQTLCLINQLVDNGHEVLGVFVVKTFQLKRLKSYIRQYGLSTVIAKFKSHFLHQTNSVLAKETKYINELRQKLQIKHKNVTSYCKELDIPFISVSNLNNSTSINKAVQLKPDLIVYSGGGILRKEFISSSKYSVLNAHSGPLPKIRGMNGIEWALFKGHKPTTTVHLIDSGIDTGSILFKEHIPFSLGDDLYDIRGKGPVHNVSLLIKVINNFEAFYKKRTPQKKNEGLQYFVMHDFLKNIINDRVKNANL